MLYLAPYFYKQYPLNFRWLLSCQMASSLFDSQVVMHAVQITMLLLGHFSLPSLKPWHINMIHRGHPCDGVLFVCSHQHDRESLAKSWNSHVRVQCAHVTWRITGLPHQDSLFSAAGIWNANALWTQESDWLPNSADLKWKLTGTPWTCGENGSYKAWEYVTGKSIF